jgi:16S rRNA (cytosine1402-N4)-methyltransferase
VDLLITKRDGAYVDATGGLGGHSQLILERLLPSGKLIIFDLDQEALSYAKENLTPRYSKQVDFRHANFADLAAQLAGRRIDGILLDLGLASFQIDSKGRGFSFRFDAPLDMRLDQSQGAMAADLINGLSQRELSQLFFKYGEESRGHIFAKRIAEARRKKPIRTTFELLKALQLPKKFGRLHPATKVFQALRIAVNDELGNLKAVLPQAVAALNPGGRLVTIAFHSLEDRLIKNFLREQAEANIIRILTKKVIKPSWSEIQNNPRARSAKLRAAEKLACEEN